MEVRLPLGHFLRFKEIGAKLEFLDGNRVFIFFFLLNSCVYLIKVNKFYWKIRRCWTWKETNVFN